MTKEKNGNSPWITEEVDIWAPEVQRGQWDMLYGKDNWQLAWQLSNKETLTFDKLISLYVDTYSKFFEENIVDAIFLTNHYSYIYAYDYISKEQAFDPQALYDKPGKADQFYHAAINLSLVNILGLDFKGSHPAGRDETKFWFPSQIPIERPDIIHPVVYRTLEDFYKNSKILQIKK